MHTNISRKIFTNFLFSNYKMTKLEVSISKLLKVLKTKPLSILSVLNIYRTPFLAKREHISNAK